MYSLRVSSTSAVFTIASAASMAPMRPRVSMSPSASPATCSGRSVPDCTILLHAQQRRYHRAFFVDTAQHYDLTSARTLRVSRRADDGCGLQEEAAGSAARGDPDRHVLVLADSARQPGRGDVSLPGGAGRD